VTLTLTASVGVAFAGPGDQISDELIRAADTAMYQAKRNRGGDHRIMDLRDAVQPGAATSTLERDLRDAVAHGDLEVAYQPIVRSADGVMTGVEALLRWTHADRGRVPPPSIVAAAEHAGLIDDIGAWVLDRSARDRAQWLDHHPGASIDMSVNVSARQLVGTDPVGMVTGVLADTGMDPGALILEVTETLLLEDSARAVAVLADLRAIGVRLALDDFGTGFSSLSYLQRLPVDIVKIDRRFISGIERPGKSSAIVEAITTMAHVLGLAVTAEGVETRPERDMVQSVGCDRAQGYYYARPMTASAIEAHLAAPLADGVVHLPA
jgi:EAL domain-containing protein (putative c-di-GMP-specific phosphodiesterase class I)